MRMAWWMLAKREDITSGTIDGSDAEISRVAFKVVWARKT